MIARSFTSITFNRFAALACTAACALALLVCATPVARAAELASHPKDLKFGKLDFEIPRAAGYRHTLSNGVVVYVAEDRSLPLVDVGVTLRIGSFLEPETHVGLSGMVGSLMRVGGAGELSAEAFDEKVDFLAANMGAFIGDTSGGASMNCYTGVLDESLDLFFDMMRKPKFQEDRLNIEKSDALENMKQRNDSPAPISGREWQWLMRGKEHFTSRFSTQSTIDAITRDDLVEFHKNYWRPDSMIMTVSGDVDTKEILDKLEARFKGWKSDGPKVQWPPAAPKATPTPGVYYVQKEIPQGRVQMGHLGHKRANWEDPDVAPLSIMNDILGGGGFTSRITKRIRSDEGLAYSAGSQFGVGDWWPGTFAVFYQSKSPTVAFAAAIAMEEIEKIRTGKVTEGELSISKNGFIDSFPRRFETASQIVGTFASDEFTGRPHKYWDTYRDNIRKVDADAVQRVAKKYLDPSKIVMLIVGDWSEIAPGDPDGRASMEQFFGGKATELPLRDPMTLEPME